MIQESIQYETSLEFARRMDREDPLGHYRDRYYFPQHQGRDTIYFCGNSLGLQPRSVEEALQEELVRWRELGVKGHFEGDLPWTEYHKGLAPQTAHVVGARESEVVVMNTLTVNLHLMMVSFYRPNPERFKIIMEAGAFPSDQYAVESQVRHHGLRPEEAIVEVQPRAGEQCLRTEDIVATIEAEGPKTALVLFAGLNYYTGQIFDMPAITEAGRRVGAYVGFDLAHAAGNAPLQLHDWDVDFAVWCSYKYLNAGPGGPSGAFIHERHAFNRELPRFAGWWGHDEARRFLMEKGFIPTPGAEGWQLSNAPILAFVPHRVSLDLFYEAGMPRLRKKSRRLTGYLEFLIDELNREGFNYPFITPRNPEERGCQLSFITGSNGRELFNYLMDNGVICDWREHNLPDANGEGAEKAGVIRIAPTPMYNSYEDVYRFVELLRRYG